MEPYRWSKIGHLFKAAEWETIRVFELDRLRKPFGLSDQGQLAYQYIFGQFETFNQLIATQRSTNTKAEPHLLQCSRILAPIFSEFWRTLADHQPARCENLLKIQKLLKWLCRKREKKGRKVDIFDVEVSLKPRRSTKTQIQMKFEGNQSVQKFISCQSAKLESNNKIMNQQWGNVDKRLQRKLRLYGSVHDRYGETPTSDSKMVDRDRRMKQKCQRVRLHSQKTIQIFKAGRSRSRPDYNDLWRKTMQM